MDGAGKQRPVSLTENQFVLLRSDTDPKKTMLGRFYGEKVTALRFGSVRPFGVKPRSVGQQFLQEALLLPAENLSRQISLVYQNPEEMFIKDSIRTDIAYAMEVRKLPEWKGAPQSCWSGSGWPSSRIGMVALCPAGRCAGPASPSASP